MFTQYQELDEELFFQPLPTILDGVHDWGVRKPTIHYINAVFPQSLHSSHGLVGRVVIVLESAGKRRENVKQADVFCKFNANFCNCSEITLLQAS